jgi:hypothetical protein
VKRDEWNFRSNLTGSGNLIFESWNCLMCARLHLFAAISSTLMIWIESARALCLAPISRSKKWKKKLKKMNFFFFFLRKQTNELMNESLALILIKINTDNKKWRHWPQRCLDILCTYYECQSVSCIATKFRSSWLCPRVCFPEPLVC